MVTFIIKLIIGFIFINQHKFFQALFYKPFYKTMSHLLNGTLFINTCLFQRTAQRRLLYNNTQTFSDTCCLHNKHIVTGHYIFVQWHLVYRLCGFKCFFLHHCAFHIY